MKNYYTPQLEEIKVELADIMTLSTQASTEWGIVESIWDLF